MHAGKLLFYVWELCDGAMLLLCEQVADYQAFTFIKSPFVVGIPVTHHFSQMPP